MNGKTPDGEANRLGRRVRRYAQVGAGMGGFAARVAGQRLFNAGSGSINERAARELKAALGGLKGPIMKVAQMLATIPDVVPPEFAAELSELQSAAPPMGWPFVRRRMCAELGADWERRFAHFEHEAAAAASLGQVHRAIGLDGRKLAVKLQYPDMQSAVDADLTQLGLLFAVYKRLDPSIDTREIYAEIRERLREELDYAREAAHMHLYADIFAKEPRIAVPEVIPALSTGRLLTMTWLDGAPLLDFRGRALEDRNRIAEAMFAAWWYPFSHYGVIHGDPHLGNYTVREGAETGGWGINCSITAASVFFRQVSSRVWSSFIARWKRGTATVRRRPMRAGGSGRSRTSLSMCSMSGRGLSMGRCLTTGCARSRTGSAPAPMGARKRSACIRRCASSAR